MVSVLQFTCLFNFLKFFLMETSEIGKDVKNIRIAHGPPSSPLTHTQLPRLHLTHSPSSQCSGANPTQRTFQRLVSTGAKEKPKQKGTKAWSLTSSALGRVQEPSRRVLPPEAHGCSRGPRLLLSQRLWLAWGHHFLLPQHSLISGTLSHLGRQPLITQKERSSLSP